MTLASPASARDSRLPRGKARAHSLLVRALRILLPAIMLAVLAILAGLVVEHALRRRAAAHQDASTPIRMTNPHFFGRDTQGRAYVLGASEASRDERSLQVVLLRNPTFTQDVGGPHPSNLTADSGVYHEDTRMLLLRGHVHGSNASDARFVTNEALINTRTGTVAGPGALATQTSQGAVKSNSFDVNTKTNTVVFKGGVHARLNSH